MLDHAGTGVSTYARILERIQVALSDRVGVLTATPSLLPPAMGAIGRHRRKTRLVPRDGDGAYRLIAPDIFRRAHVHFGIYGRLLPVSPALRFGIMHWTYPVPLHLRGWINIYSIHDVIPITQPDLSSVSPKRLDSTLRAIAEVADAITTISDASLEAIAALGIFRRDRLTNVGLTIEEVSLPDPDIFRSFHQAGLRHKNYLLFSGSIEQRKNVPRMLAAYRQSGLSMPLVIVGPETPGGEGIEEDIRCTPGAIRLPYQTKDALNALVTGARALIFVSLAEGFGLPVIEAMARETVVLSSKIAAIDEVAGGAALLVDPTDEHAIARGMVRLATDQALVDELAFRGRERTRFHSTKRFSENISDLYESFAFSQAKASGSIGRR